MGTTMMACCKILLMTIYYRQSFGLYYDTESNNVDNKRSLHIYSSRRIFKNRYGRILWILTCRTRSLRSSCACLANSKWTKFVILKMIYTLFVKGLYRFLDLLYQEFLLISPLCKKDN